MDKAPGKDKSVHGEENGFKTNQNGHIRVLTRTRIEDEQFNPTWESTN